MTTPFSPGANVFFATVALVQPQPGCRWTMVTGWFSGLEKGNETSTRSRPTGATHSTLVFSQRKAATDLGQKVAMDNVATMEAAQRFIFKRQ